MVDYRVHIGREALQVDKPRDVQGGEKMSGIRGSAGVGDVLDPAGQDGIGQDSAEDIDDQG